MEKAEKLKKRRPQAAHVDGLRNKRARAVERREADEDEVEEFFAILRRMRGAVKYFEGASGGDGRMRGLATWRAALETGTDELAVNGGPVNEVEPRRERDGLVLDLNASPEECNGGDWPARGDAVEARVELSGLREDRALETVNKVE